MYMSLIHFTLWGCEAASGTGNMTTKAKKGEFYNISTSLRNECHTVSEECGEENIPDVTTRPKPDNKSTVN